MPTAKPPIPKPPSLTGKADQDVPKLQAYVQQLYALLGPNSQLFKRLAAAETRLAAIGALQALDPATATTAQIATAVNSILTAAKT